MLDKARLLMAGLTRHQGCARTAPVRRDSADSAKVMERAARIVRSVALVMPARDRMRQELNDAAAAQQRGYFLPDEDERIRDVYARYLSVRAALMAAVETIQGLLEDLGKGDDDDLAWEARLKAFVVGFAAAAMLMRAASFMVDLAVRRSVVRKKLDEAEPRYGIPAKSFRTVYKSLGSMRKMWRFHGAMRFYELHRKEIALLAHDPVVGELVEMLREEAHFLQYRKSDYLKNKFHYGLYSIKRHHVSGYKKAMFHLLRLSGSMVSEMKQPFVKAPGQGKRVSPGVLSELRSLLRAGDVLITRHDDAMSNLFLPGFWPHAALYIGDANERAELGLAPRLSDDVSDDHGVRKYHFLEAKKDGVLLRPIEETLHVDAFMILRPKLEREHRVEALSRALSHEGKLYDFMFDFRMADRLACTEVIYRSYHGVGEEDRPVSFELKRHSGRPCISAEDLIEQALESGYFEKLADFGVDGETVRIF